MEWLTISTLRSATGNNKNRDRKYKDIASMKKKIKGNETLHIYISGIWQRIWMSSDTETG